ncbi:MAG TPA: ATP synthase F1 subunit epsilon [Patescibacteria group bacterium]|nr:ATP synthase F1 subunit epsilon [Patescibacteria group bacterium]
MALRFKLVTPDRVLIDEDVQSISLPTPDGEITILPNHVPLASLLVPGIAHVVREQGAEEIAVSSGFIRVGNDGTVNVLADTAEQGHELDLSIIEEAKKRAENVMKQAVMKDDASFAQAAAGLEREMARYKLAIKHRSGKGAHVPPPDRDPIN